MRTTPREKRSFPQLPPTLEEPEYMDIDEVVLSTLLE